MKKCCEQCPWKVKNKHNDIIIDFSKKNKKRHNCHMTDKGKLNLWDVDDKNICAGAKLLKVD